MVYFYRQGKQHLLLSLVLGSQHSTVIVHLIKELRTFIKKFTVLKNKYAQTPSDVTLQKIHASYDVILEYSNREME